MKYRINRRFRLSSCKRLLAWFLSLAMLLDCLPSYALADEQGYAEEYAPEQTAAYEEPSAQPVEDAYEEPPAVSEDPGPGDDVFGNDSGEEITADDSWSEETPDGDDSYEEGGMDDLFQEVDYMPGSDTTYTAMWEEEEREPAWIEVEPEVKDLVYDFKQSTTSIGAAAPHGRG